MGPYSTVDITRADALNIIYENLDSATDEELADVLFALLESRICHNYMIVDSYSSDSCRLYSWDVRRG